MDDHLGVRGRGKAVTPCLELGPELAVVVDLAVEDDPYGAVLVGQGLAARIEVDDAETPHPDPERPVAVDASAVGSPMENRLRHLLQDGRRGRLLAIAAKEAEDPAHVRTLGTSRSRGLYTPHAQGIIEDLHVKEAIGAEPAIDLGVPVLPLVRGCVPVEGIEPSPAPVRMHRDWRYVLEHLAEQR